MYGVFFSIGLILISLPSDISQLLIVNMNMDHVVPESGCLVKLSFYRLQTLGACRIREEGFGFVHDCLLARFYYLLNIEFGYNAMIHGITGRNGW